ncbi:MAG: Flp pilus assembly complex ATPase component TadA [Candidatus Omnitrophica bacterium]|nr:Flp pilus assembly complex ATPase component TadA [Candidatus Omnitrophota bacterium]
MAKKLNLILADILREKGIISQKQLEEILKEIESTKKSIREVIIQKGVISEEKFLALLSERFKLKILNLKSISIDKEILEKIPAKIATYYRFLPVELKERTLTIAVSFPLEIKIQDEIRTQLGYDIEMVLITERELDEALSRYYGLGKGVLEKMDSAFKDTGTKVVSEEGIEDIEKLAEDASIINLVNQIILEGIKKRATDIHIEPYRGGVTLRYRIDGILYDVPVAGEVKNFLPAIISRIKIMSNLNIVERRLPQDGRAIVKIQEQVLDLRISTIPTPLGESVVIRILPTQMLFSLEKLGLSQRDLKIFEALIQKPHGIIFVTGPTGSGKTTTLYACLTRLNTKERKIITIEDPIEYEIPGITQIQVHPEIGLDFARGLRSILRHDPDVIMVGEVRDQETAEIAIRMALTGHLVFSTLHTNDAVSGITRLLDIGVEPYLVSSSVEAFIAQRLIRLNCVDCKVEDTSAPLELKDMIADDLKLKSREVKVFRSKGCPRCNFTGFFGRTAIYEILVVGEAIKEAILKKYPANQIKKIAIEEGMQSLRQDGWQKVILGLTTPEEVMKVTPSEEEVFKKVSVSMPSGLTEIVTTEIPSDQRIWPRIPLKLNLRFRVIKSDLDLFKKELNIEQMAVTKNISCGGLLFVFSENIPVGSILELKLEIPDGEPILECLARLSRVEEIEEGRVYEMGVCFLDLSLGQRARLERYLKRSGLKDTG